MSVRHNILANYASQIYVTLIGIFMVPNYVHYMGAEAYGLVGFFAMLLAWFQLLDMGLTPTLTRETARFNGGATNALSLRRLLRALEGIFICIALLGSAAMMAGSSAIASSWLNVQFLPIAEVKHAIMLMAIVVALRWICGLYRGVISGFEQLVWLSAFNIAIATARFVLVVPVFLYIGTSPTDFFTYQVLVALIELMVLVTQTYRLMPKIENGSRTPWQWEPLRGVLRFSLSIAFTSSVWVLVTQTDKLVLSKLLPLADYAYFTLAVLVAGGVMIVSGPISGAILPRLSKLSAEGDEAGLIRLYRSASQLVSVIAISVALILACFSEQVLWAWTGDAAITGAAAQALQLYALGNGILALGAFPYYLQFAKGDLKLHLIGSLLFLVILIPTLIAATWKYGVTGAGYAWLGANAAYFIFWVPKVHNRFVTGLHTQWVIRDVGLIALASAATAVGLKLLLTWPHDRILSTLQIILISVAILAAAAAASSTIRRALATRWNNRFTVPG